MNFESQSCHWDSHVFIICLKFGLINNLLHFYEQTLHNSTQECTMGKSYRVYQKAVKLYVSHVLPKSLC